MSLRDLCVSVSLALTFATSAGAIDFPSPVQGGGPTLTVSGIFAALRRTDTMCVLPGAQITLDAGLLGEDHLVSDCGGTVSSSSPVTVLPPTGETIQGAASYQLIVPGQAASFRRTAFGWTVH